MSVEKDIIVKDTRKAKESIKHSQHKDDGAKIVGVMTGVGGAAVGGVAAATGTTVMGASIAGLQIGGGVGSWLLSHGIGTAVVATSFALPVFLGIALPALVGATGYTLLKNWQNNRDIKDFNTTVDIDTLGKKMAAPRQSALIAVHQMSYTSP